MYNVYVEDFMVHDVRYIWHGISYQKLKEILKENRKLRGFPLVDNPDSMILLGSIQRLELIKLIEKHIGRERRLQVIQTSLQHRARRHSCRLLYICAIAWTLLDRAKMAQGGRGESARRNGTADARTGTNEEAIEIRGHSSTGHSQDAATER
jgi:hypothetical protein